MYRLYRFQWFQHTFERIIDEDFGCSQYVSQTHLTADVSRDISTRIPNLDSRSLGYSSSLPTNVSSYVSPVPNTRSVALLYPSPQRRSPPSPQEIFLFLAMPTILAFLSLTPPFRLPPHTSSCTSFRSFRTAHLKQFHLHYPRTYPLVSLAQSPKLVKGSIVLTQQGTQLSLAQVTDIASSGDTIDILPLEEFVNNLYVPSKSSAPTYVPSTSVRKVNAEYVPSQQGWIVLQQDIDQAANYFTSRPADMRERVEVVDKPPEPLSEEALKRQLFPSPTKAQAFFGAALSLPLAATFYAGFTSVKQSYRTNSVDDEFLGGTFGRQIALYSTAGASLAIILVGCGLFLYALGKQEKKA